MGTYLRQLKRDMAWRLVDWGKKVEATHAQVERLQPIRQGFYIIHGFDMSTVTALACS